MPQGWTNSDEKTNRDTSGASDVTDPSPATKNYEPVPDPLATAINTPLSEFQNPLSDPFSTDIQTPVSSPSSPSVERGLVAVEPGLTVFGKYQVIERLGKGGMGEVWLVKDVELDVKRAVKMITQGTAFNAQARARFRREAQAMAKFTHPNVVAVHDARLDSQDIAYIVMEYVAGVSLEKVIKPNVPMPLDWTLHVLTQLCDALQEAHSQGIIHRDLKPSNLILVNTRSKTDQLKVFDFGIAKILHVDETTSQDPGTLAGTFIGTPPYASPEQAGGQAVLLSDIYSVGVILYEFLTGCRPFSGRPAFLIASTMFNNPPPFTEINPDANVPPEIERVVMRCLAKQPEDRPQSAMELLNEFKAAMPTVEYVPENHTQKLPGYDPDSFDYSRFRRSRTGIVVAVLALVVVVGGVLAAVVPGLLKRPEKGSITVLPEPPVKPVEPPTPTPPPTPPVVRPDQIAEAGRSFTLWKNQFYLPNGYVAVDQAGAAPDGWPLEVIRKEDGVKFLRIPGGTLQMGARDKPDAPRSDADSTNQPAHEVVVKGFYIQKHEVTNGEMLAYVEKYGKRFPEQEAIARWRELYEDVVRELNSEKALKHPAPGITWKLADDFARKKSAFLPTEAQWEFAARSRDSGRVLVWNIDLDLSNKVDDLANLDQTSYKNNIWTSAVGEYQKDQTLQGVMDMAGNLREWCRDPWVAYDVQVAKGLVQALETPTPDTVIVLRGGSFNLNSDFKFMTHRGKGLRLSDEVPPNVGFRLVLECPE